jgi:uncharacterized membrane protein (UPF0127 family)
MLISGVFGSWKFWRVKTGVAAAILLLLFAAWPADASSGPADPPQFDESNVVLHTAQGPYELTVEMALSGAQRSYGLMFRTQLGPDRGMLFDFGRETFISMWMRNTFIPLDMVFIDRAGRITFIRENTTPQSLETIEAPGRNRAVLEVAAGTVARLGIRVGDRVAHAIFR